MSDDLSEHDKELLKLIGMSGEQVLADERMAESETIPDDLTGCVHHGLHLALQATPIVNVSRGASHAASHDVP